MFFVTCSAIKGGGYRFAQPALHLVVGRNARIADFHQAILRRVFEARNRLKFLRLTFRFKKHRFRGFRRAPRGQHVGWIRRRRNPLRQGAVRRVSLRAGRPTLAMMPYRQLQNGPFDRHTLF